MRILSLVLATSLMATAAVSAHATDEATATKAPKPAAKEAAAPAIAVTPPMPAFEAPKPFAEIKEGTAATWPVTGSAGAFGGNSGMCSTNRNVVMAAPVAGAAAPLAMPGSMMNISMSRTIGGGAGVGGGPAESLMININSFGAPKKSLGGMLVGGDAAGTVSSENANYSTTIQVADIGAFKKQLKSEDTVTLQLGETKQTVPSETILAVVDALDKCAADNKEKNEKAAAEAAKKATASKKE